MQEQKELYKNDEGKWCLYPYLITCSDKGVKEVKYEDNKEYYEKIQREDFTLDEVVEIQYKAEQLERLNDVQGLSYEHFSEIYNYVIDGIVKVDSNIFAFKNVAKLNQSVNEQSEILADIIGGAF